MIYKIVKKVQQQQVGGKNLIYQSNKSVNAGPKKKH
jgi:hypothetical protein